MWRELLADLTTPVAAFLRARRRRARLPARVGRARAVGPLVVRRPPAGGHARRARRPTSTVDAPLPADIPLDRGVLAAVEASSRTYRSPSLPDLPPLHGGLVGYLGYDVVREVEHLPDVPADDLGNPDAVLSIIGELAAYDHCRQRVTLVANAFVPPGATRRRPRRRVRRRASPGSSSSRTTAPVRSTSRWSSRPIRDEPLPEVRSSMGAAPVLRRGRGGARAHPRRRHLPGRARAALRPRPRRRPVRRVPRAAAGQPEPVHVLLPPSRADARRLVARADGAAARRHGSSPARSPAPAAAAAPTRTTAGSRPSSPSTRRSAPST